MTDDELRVPFRNMVYIGDSDTDIPCMKLVSSNGGFSIGVYGKDSKNKVYKMIEENRIKYFAEADYSEGSELELLLKNIIDRTAANEVLERKNAECIREMKIERRNKDEEFIKKEDLIDQLRESFSVSKTHEVIKEMNAINTWDVLQIERILKIGLTKTQIIVNLHDRDIKSFYEKMCSKSRSNFSKKWKKF